MHALATQDEIKEGLQFIDMMVAAEAHSIDEKKIRRILGHLQYAVRHEKETVDRKNSKETQKVVDLGDDQEKDSENKTSNIVDISQKLPLSVPLSILNSLSAPINRRKSSDGNSDFDISHSSPKRLKINSDSDSEDIF